MNKKSLGKTAKLSIVILGEVNKVNQLAVMVYGGIVLFKGSKLFERKVIYERHICQVTEQLLIAGMFESDSEFHSCHRFFWGPLFCQVPGFDHLMPKKHLSVWGGIRVYHGTNMPFFSISRMKVKKAEHMLSPIATSLLELKCHPKWCTSPPSPSAVFRHASAMQRSSAVPEDAYWCHLNGGRKKARSTEWSGLKTPKLLHIRLIFFGHSMSFHEQLWQHALLRQKIRHMVNLKEDLTTWWARLWQRGFFWYCFGPFLWFSIMQTPMPNTAILWSLEPAFFENGHLYPVFAVWHYQSCHIFQVNLSLEQWLQGIPGKPFKFSGCSFSSPGCNSLTVWEWEKWTEFIESIVLMTMTRRTRNYGNNLRRPWKDGNWMQLRSCFGANDDEGYHLVLTRGKHDQVFRWVDRTW